MAKKQYAKMKYFPLQEKLVKILSQKTQNRDLKFFRLLVAFYMAQVASSMRCSVKSQDRGVIPVNMYAINLAGSGYGKGNSTNILVDDVLHKFRKRFTNETFPNIVDESLDEIAEMRCAISGNDLEDELQIVRAEFESLGKPVFSFDSGTIPAIKQFRQMLIMGKCGAITMIADEIGSNIMELSEPLKVFFELYDKGVVGDKLTKNSKENTRVTQMIGKTPANMLLFGTPTKLFDGGAQEREFRSLTSTGYARRCFFGYGRVRKKEFKQTPEEIFDALTADNSNQILAEAADAFEVLAGEENFNQVITMDRDASIELITYKMDCEKRAQSLPTIKEDERNQLSHSYFKVLKLAGVYAFMDGSAKVKKNHLYAAMRMAEDSTTAFNDKICHIERNHVRLAKYLADSPTAVTHADILKDLSFYPTNVMGRREIIELAASYGYTENIAIIQTKDGQIDLFKGERLKVTSLSEMICSYSTKITTEYENNMISFEDVAELCGTKGYHWINHHTKGGYRDEAHMCKGFNMVCIDVDKFVDISTVEMLLHEYNYIIYTTKRHTNKKNRFRIVMPLTHHMKIGKSVFKEFMRNIFEWLPFEVDEATPQRSRKWLSHNGNVLTNSGKLLDAQDFIPKTPKAILLNQRTLELADLSTMERWFMGHMEKGNRSDSLIRYALMLVDMGMGRKDIQQRVLDLNSKIGDGLSETEILTTVMLTVIRKLDRNDAEEEQE